MALLRNIALMGASTAMRLGFGLLTFVFMARMLGPDRFGLVMLWLSVATLASLIANFGFTPYLLREIGARPETARDTMSEVLTAKLILSTTVALFGAGALYWIEGSSRLVFIALLLALLADSMTEFFNVGFRATNRFAAETRLASIASLLQFSIVAGAVWWRPQADIAALAFMASRFAVLAITWGAQSQYFSGLKKATIRRGIARVHDAKAFAVDFGLQSLLGQVDSVVLNHYIGPAAVGVYQAGLRLFNGGAQAASVLANVFLPRAALVANDKARFAAEAQKVQWAFIAIGLAFGLLLALGARPIVHYMFGPQFNELVTVLPWLGALFFVRFFASSWGIVLTSAGQQSFRAVINFTQWVIVIALATQAVPVFGTVGWLISLLVGNLFIAIAYTIRGFTYTGVRWLQIAIPVCATLSFVPLLHAPMN